MLLLVTSKLNDEQFKHVSEDIEGYIKFVMDAEQEIMTAGGKKHVEGEQLLLQKGSKQQNLWGGGVDLETGEMDFDSMINLRPKDNNPSREVLSMELRKRIEQIVRKFINIEIISV